MARSWPLWAGRRLVSVKSNSWDASEGKLRHAVRVGYDTLFGAAFSPDGRRLSFGLTDKTARVIEVETGKELLKIEHHDDWVFGTVFSVDGKKLVSVGRDRAAKLTEVSSGAFVENINALKGQLACIARHPREGHCADRRRRPGAVPLQDESA